MVVPCRAGSGCQAGRAARALLELSRPDYDRLRDEWLHRQGLRVLRIDAQLVERDIGAAVATVRDALDETGRR
jgi:very-short-patch-repair endonuclease